MRANTHIRFTALWTLFGTIQVSRYHKINLDFTEARDSEWQWHQMDHKQIYTLTQTHNHTNTPPLSFLQAGCPSCHPTNSVKALKETDRQTDRHTHHNTLHPFQEAIIRGTARNISVGREKGASLTYHTLFTTTWVIKHHNPGRGAPTTFVLSHWVCENLSGYFVAAGGLHPWVPPWANYARLK